MEIRRSKHLANAPRDGHDRLERAAARGDEAAKAKLKALEAASRPRRLADFPRVDPVKAAAALAGKIVDEHRARELVLWVDNTQSLYNYKKEIARNAIKHYLKNRYDPDLAPKAWLHVADAAAADYTKNFSEHGPNGAYGSFNKATRLRAAWDLLADFAEEARSGEYEDIAEELVHGRRRNPEDRERLERAAARGDKQARLRLVELDQAALPPPETPEARIRAVIARLNAIYDVGLSFGYTGNWTPQDGNKYYLYSVYSKIPPEVGRYGTVSYGNIPPSGLEDFAAKIEAGALEPWIEERLLPRANLRYRHFRIKSRERHHWEPIELILTRLGASFGLRGGGEWHCSISGTTLSDVIKALEPFRGTEIKETDW